MKPRPDPDTDLKQIVEAAAYFTAAIQWNQQLCTYRFPTLATARNAGNILEATAKNGRKAMIYAVTPDQQSHFIPATFTI